MDAILSQAGSTLVRPTVVPVEAVTTPVAPATAVTPADSSVNSEGARGSRTPFDHALFQGNGAKTGIVKRLSAEEIETVQGELGLKAQEAAAKALPEVNVDPVDAIPVDAANVDVQVAPGIQLPEGPQLLFDVSTALPEPPTDPAPPTGDGIVTITEFVQAGLTASTDD